MEGGYQRRCRPAELRRSKSARLTPQSRSASDLIYMHICAYSVPVSFEWDPVKAEANLTKHGVEFVDVFAVFEDDFAMNVAESSCGEERFVAIGMDGLGRVVVVCYTWRGDNVRIISARAASPSEREAYVNER